MIIYVSNNTLNGFSIMARRKRYKDEIDPAAAFGIFVIACIYFAWTHIIKPIIDWIIDLVNQVINLVTQNIDIIIIVILFAIILLAVWLRKRQHVKKQRDFERRKYIDEQTAKGLFKFSDRFGKEKWGSREETEEWKRHDEEEKLKESLLNRACESINDFKPFKNQSAWSKGDDFENFVAKQFHKNNDYTVVNWTGDKMRKYNVYVESDSGPDLKIRHEPTQEEFYIECKYRSNLYNGKYKWTNDKQRKRYLKFASNTKNPFYIVLGLGGSPNEPNKIYCVPLREARYVGLYPFVFEKYYHDPEVDLVWKNGILK